MGKILLLSFDENEDGILNQILTFLNTGDRTYNLLEHMIERRLIFFLKSCAGCNSRECPGKDWCENRKYSLEKGIGH